MDKVISHLNVHAHTQTQRVRTPLLGGTRPLQYKPSHSGGLGISSINRAAGLLSSLLLELILTQWPERLPFYIWSMLNSQMARRPDMSCLIVQILVNWANGRLGRVAENGKVENGKIQAHQRSRSIMFPWIQIDPCFVVRQTCGCDVFLMLWQHEGMLT